MNSTEDQQGRPHRHFKKFVDNRRLYDADKSMYATVADLAQAVQTGAEVSVTAIKGRATKGQRVIEEDMTQALLIEALAHAQRNSPTLAVDDLHRLIRGETPRWD